ncbi:hypothetical protein BSKO_07080 [Bryopsis sp. KO-2023]|nr:hypothetical protein BSKO_07080 [Bryopsis sp. KO-2023]
MMDSSSGTLLYTEAWTEEFRREADVELVVEGIALAAHSTILCQSEVLGGAIRETKNTGGKIRIESLFDGTEVEDVDLFLSHVYATSQRLSSTKPHESRKVHELAVKCGFDALAIRVLDTLTLEPKFLQGLRVHLNRLDPDTILYWLNVFRLTEHQGLGSSLSQFFGQRLSIFSTVRLEWSPVRQALENDSTLLLKILSVVSRSSHENVFL